MPAPKFEGPAKPIQVWKKVKAELTHLEQVYLIVCPVCNMPEHAPEHKERIYSPRHFAALMNNIAYEL
ncbi:unnamed protein product [Bursaphelenchus okinawaensis]|uniref:Uncharacterized protein n=1 Tax=Bursaphelenchus okinawaensis TaxID=465554 RepID=A0A811KUC5_9BILA|nr:unnamed protein product [Bursaphelenchus okinawaensis]CAG9110626.1 unnamed protein product [Bursaphelenchus okinawaensis]